jgi:carbon monoxide dehydrogenase subunit G
MKFEFYFAVSITLDNLWTVLRNIRSATACLTNSESIQKENFMSTKVFPISKHRSVTDNR